MVVKAGGTMAGCSPCRLRKTFISASFVAFVLLLLFLFLLVVVVVWWGKNHCLFIFLLIFSSLLHF